VVGDQWNFMSWFGQSLKGRASASGFCLAVAARHPKFRNSSRSIFVLYGFFIGSTGRIYLRFQVLALRWILRFSTLKNTIFQIETGSIHK